MPKCSFNKFNNLNYSTKNKSSQEYLNSKFLGNIKLHFNKVCYSDNHILICDILLKYLEQNNDSLVDILINYDIEKDLFDKIIKFSSFFNDTFLATNKSKIKDICK